MPSWRPWSNHGHELALSIAAAVDVALRRRDRSMAGEIERSLPLLTGRHDLVDEADFITAKNGTMTSGPAHRVDRDLTGDDGSASVVTFFENQQPWKIMSIASRDWAVIGYSL